MLLGPLARYTWSEYTLKDTRQVKIETHFVCHGKHVNGDRRVLVRSNSILISLMILISLTTPSKFNYWSWRCIMCTTCCLGDSEEFPSISCLKLQKQKAPKGLLWESSTRHWFQVSQVRLGAGSDWNLKYGPRTDNRVKCLLGFVTSSWNWDPREGKKKIRIGLKASSIQADRRGKKLFPLLFLSRLLQLCKSSNPRCSHASMGFDSQTNEFC